MQNSTRKNQGKLSSRITIRNCVSDHALNLDTSCHPYEIKVMKDNLTVQYIGRGNHHQDVGTVRSCRSVSSQLSFFYYEVIILDAGEHGRISIGIGTKEFPMNRLPGTLSKSFGYNGEDGHFYSGKSKGDVYGPQFSKNDVVGCFIHFYNQEIFFTKNGKDLGVAYRGDLSGEWFPIIGLHSEGEIVRVNFGSNKNDPWMFDIDHVLHEYEEQQYEQVKAIKLPENIAINCVADYLLHFGYEKTYHEFKKQELQLNNEVVEKHNLHLAKDSLHVRSQIRLHLLNGEIDEATDLIVQRFPGLLDGNNLLMFKIKSLQFIDMIIRKESLEKTLQFSQKSLSPFYKPDEIMSDKDGIQRELRDTMGLLAYQDPFSSPLQHLVLPEHREAIVDEVNRAIFKQLQVRETPLLERLLRQLLATQQTIRSTGNGVIFDLAI